MKKIIFVSYIVMTGFSAFSQAGKNAALMASKTNPHLKVFNQAVICGDLNTGIMALNYYIADQGYGNPYADTLAMLYMQSGAYPQCYYWADKRLKDKPEDNGLLEMKGISLDKMQQPKEAIEVFEKLYGKTKSPYHAYKLMELQYSIKRLAECVATASSAEKLQFKPEFVMTYTVGDQTGRTYLQAGVYNIHGLALYDLDRKTEAKVYFQKAIDLDSNFALARQNLEAMNTMEKKPGKVSGNNPAPLNQPASKQN